MRVLIVGGGIGGLAAARALLQDGHHVDVFEQATGQRGGGAALTLWSNGTGILRELHVSLEGVGAPIDALEQRDDRGRRLFSLDVSRAAAHYGHPHVCLPRRRLLERLADGLPTEVVHYGRVCTKVDSYPGGVRMHFNDGTEALGDVLVGADGRNSVVRNAIWTRDPAELTGWVTWQGVTSLDHEVTPSRRGLMFVGDAGLCGLMPAGEGLLQWWFDQREAPGTPATPSPVAALRERFKGWPAAVQQVLAAIRDEDVGDFPHYRHVVPLTWGEGNMTILGDAAHSMPPTRAQGANQALEDAWALAITLRQHGDVAAALRNYEHGRSPKAGFVAKQAATEDTNERPPWLARLIPRSVGARIYTRWLGKASNYLN